MFKKLFNRPFFKETAFGRTLSGRNKTGQALGIVKDTALTFFPVVGKPISQITGTITDNLEAQEIGRRVEDLNLSPITVKALRLGVLAGIGFLLLKAAVNGQLMAMIETLKPVLELLKELGVL